MNFVGLVFSVVLFVSSTVSTQIYPTLGDFDGSKVSLGTVGARYIPQVEKRIKTRVQNDSGKYDYDLFGRESFEYFPLQLGNGNYKISIYENVADNRYMQVKQTSLNAELKDQVSVYTASIQTVNWNYDMEVIKKANELCKSLKTDKEKINAIYKYVISTLRYDYEKIKKLETTYVPDIEQIIKDKKGICYDYSAVFAAMLRSQNIPAKLLKGYSSYVNEYHAWNEVYIAEKNSWIVVDTTYDSVMMRNKRSYKMEKDSSKYKASKVY